MDFVELARTRYTTKHYSGKAIPCETMEKLFELLRLAPSSVNSQPWVYFHARTAEQKEKLLPAILDFNRERVTLASDVIVFAIRDAYDEAMFKRVLDKEIADGRYADETKVEGLDAGRRHFVGLHSETPESLHAWEQAQSYIAMGFLLAAAESYGIDSTALEGLDCAELDRILDTKSQGLKVVAAVSLGYRAENDSNATRPKSRLALSDIVREV